MDSLKQQKRLINEGIIQNILNWIVDRQYWKAKKMFEEDPELQKIYKRAFDAFEKAEKQAEDYCKKYGCVEPDKHTVKLEKFKDMRARDRKNKK